MEKRVALCPPSYSCHGWLVRDITQVNIKMILKHGNVAMVTVPQRNWDGVKQSNSLHSQGALSGILKECWSSKDRCWDGLSASSTVKNGEGDVITSSQALAELPHEDNDISFSPSLLAVHLEDL